MSGAENVHGDSSSASGGDAGCRSVGRRAPSFGRLGELRQVDAPVRVPPDLDGTAVDQDLLDARCCFARSQRGVAERQACKVRSIRVLPDRLDAELRDAELAKRRLELGRRLADPDVVSTVEPEDAGRYVEADGFAHVAPLMPVRGCSQT